MNEPGLLECLRADKPHYGSWLDTLSTLGFWTVLHYRIARWLHVHHADIVARFVQLFCVVVTGADISRRAQIGPGLMISHPQGIFIGPGVVMGRDCVLTQGCGILVDTWGNREHSEFPVLEDRVYVGSGAKILGGVTIHHDARISPNSVVLKDVPVNATALGVPARVIPFEFRHEGG